MSRVLIYDITATIKAPVKFTVEAHDENEATDLANAYLEEHIDELALEALDSGEFNSADAEVIETTESDENGEDDEDWPEDDWDREQRASHEEDAADDRRFYNENESLGLILNKVNKIKD
jgi:hypothetical protein